MGQQFLAPETRVHTHDQHKIDTGQHVIERVNGRGRIQHDSRVGAKIPDQPHAAIQMRAGFLMNGNHLRPGFNKGGDVAVRLFDHQVAVEQQIRRRPQAVHHRHAD